MHIKKSLNSGITENQVRAVLLNKGWKKEQIDFVLNKFKKK